MDRSSRYYPGGPGPGLAKLIDDQRQLCPGRPLLAVNEQSSRARDVRTMALAVVASLLIHVLVAARLLSAPGLALQTSLDTDAMVAVLLYTPEPSAPETALPEDKVPAEPSSPPAPVVDTPPPPPPQPGIVPQAAPPPPGEVASPSAPAEAAPPPEAVAPARPLPTAPPVAAPTPQGRRPVARLPSLRAREPARGPAAPGPQPAAPTAFAALTPARPLQGFSGNRDPIYPEAAKRRGEQGRVMLRVNVSSGGEPVAVIVQQSSGFPRLDAAAAAAVRLWRFEPAARDGKTVEGIAEVPILFRLEH